MFVAKFPGSMYAMEATTAGPANSSFELQLRLRPASTSAIARDVRSLIPNCPSAVLTSILLHELDSHVVRASRPIEPIAFLACTMGHREVGQIANAPA